MSKNTTTTTKRTKSRFTMGTEPSPDLAAALGPIAPPAPISSPAETPYSAPVGDSEAPDPVSGTDGAGTPAVTPVAAPAPPVAAPRAPSTSTSVGSSGETKVDVEERIAKRVRDHAAKLRGVGFTQLLLHAIQSNQDELSQTWQVDEQDSGAGDELFPGLATQIKAAKNTSAVPVDQITLSGWTPQIRTQVDQLRVQWNAPSFKALVNKAFELEYAPKKSKASKTK